MKIALLFITAIIVNLLVFAILKHSDNGFTEDVPFWDHVNEIIWIIAFISAVTFSIINRKILFRKLTSIVTVLVLLLYTPFPFVLIYQLFNN